MIVFEEVLKDQAFDGRVGHPSFSYLCCSFEKTYGVEPFAFHYPDFEIPPFLTLPGFGLVLSVLLLP